MTIVGWIVLGVVAGWLAGMIMRGGGYGLIGDLVLGVLGAFVGGWLWGFITHDDVTVGFNLPSLLIAVLGAVVLIGIPAVLASLAGALADSAACEGEETGSRRDQP